MSETSIERWPAGGSSLFGGSGRLATNIFDDDDDDGFVKQDRDIPGSELKVWCEVIHVGYILYGIGYSWDDDHFCDRLEGPESSSVTRYQLVGLLPQLWPVVSSKLLLWACPIIQRRHCRYGEHHRVWTLVFIWSPWNSTKSHLVVLLNTFNVS